LYIFYNGPAANSFNSGRFKFYSVDATPTVKMDGLKASSTPSTYPDAIDERLKVPSYTEINVNIVGNVSGGTAYISVKAEQEPSETDSIRVWCAIIEDKETADSDWGGYSGMEMMWIPVSFPLGKDGRFLNFTGPYPQTINVSGEYKLKPSEHTFENLRVVTFVQYTGGTKECLNAHYMDLPDTATGIYDPEAEAMTGAGLSVWPNPCTGDMNIECSIPEGISGTVRVYDVSGRIVESFAAGEATCIRLEEDGVYFVTLNTSDGEVVRRMLTVLK